ncbi:cation:proton antiporter [Streptomyces olindensis]|uniref:cation:proton antiporter n=1 Tax=Streptomyces olindensis TaxID=358823 RepID=UPI003696FE26
MTSHPAALFLIDLSLILAVARALGAVAVQLRQPPVVGEILAGILFGPTLFHGAITQALFPSGVRSVLSSMSSVGVALFMFCVGLEIEHRFLRGRGRLTAGAALGSTLVPFALGIPLGLFLLQDRTVGRPVAFLVFIGLSVSVTAFPVLARILSDRGLSRTQVGGIALATAAVVDVVAWSGLAAIQAVCGGGTPWQLALVVPFVAVLALVVRPLLRRVLAVAGGPVDLTSGRLSVVLVGALLSGAATELMGLHYIFGAFLFGLVVPREVAPRVRADISERTGQVTSVLLPVYFVVAGFQVDLTGVDGSRLLEFAAILLVAVAGKFGGTYLGARTQGLEPRPALVLAALMNTRGLTELIILGVGLQLGLLDGPLYSLMVLMALVTTAMSGPLLTWMYRRPVEIGPPAGRPSREPAADGEASAELAEDGPRGRA